MVIVTWVNPLTHQREACSNPMPLDTARRAVRRWQRAIKADGRPRGHFQMIAAPLDDDLFGYPLDHYPTTTIYTAINQKQSTVTHHDS